MTWGPTIVKNMGCQSGECFTPQNGDDDLFFPQLILLKSWEPLSPTVLFRSNSSNCY